MEASLVEIESVTKRFGSQAAVRSVTLEVRRGEFFSLLGSSGCGKSTLLRLVAGFEFPDEGEIRVAGRGHRPVPAHVDRANMVFQNYALFPHMSVAENLAFPLRMVRCGKAETAARVAGLLAVVQMEAFGNRLPRQLSGGQQQRVALARALVGQPDVVLLDEPLGALDLRLREELQVELKRIQRETGSTFIYVTHDQGEALRLSDRLAVMNAGQLEQVGTPEAIYERPATEFVASFIGETNFLEGEAGRGALRPERVRLMREGDGRAAGVIEEVAYHGASRRCLVRLDDGRGLMIRTGEAVGPIGGRVGVLWDDADVHPLARGQGVARDAELEAR
ncbi:MAG: ABC transporter ATP-binding protein [Verrucomicrobiales bacterium]